MDTLRSEVFTIHEPIVNVNLNHLNLNCSYSCEEMVFTEKFEIDIPSSNKIVSTELNNVSKLISIAAATSYFKAFRAHKINVEFPITKSVATWAGHLFDHGLLEFRFANDFDLTEKIDFDYELVDDSTPNINESSTVLIPIGGGKDSVTTIEIARNAGLTMVGFSVGDFKAINDCARAADIELVKVSRTIDGKLLKLNDQGRPNGHIPVTAITSSLACLAAQALGFGFVAMSNENSANEPTRIVNGLEVNHQWSKSSKAEELLRSALSSFGIPVDYFSALRSLSEFQIFELFSDFENFHSKFTSCNKAFKLDENSRSKSWCGNCEKCRFVFLGLAAFKGVDYSTQIIGKNLFDDSNQIQGFIDLVEINSKPFECIGTINESKLLSRNCLIWDAASNSIVGKALKEKLSLNSKLEEKIVEAKLETYAPSFITDSIDDLKHAHFVRHLKAHIKDVDFALMGIGRDTAAIVKFLFTYGDVRKFKLFLPVNSPHNDVSFDALKSEFSLDQIDIELIKVNDLNQLENSLVFVSPGISKYSDEVTFIKENTTTPLAWWLEYMQLHFPEKIFIGVTGTKGKSTVSSMIAHVLDDSIIAGNLGIGVGDISFNDLLKAKYIVLEVSSFQSSYVTSSPDVAVFTSLFDCHIDWHLTPQNYRNDKFNLAMHGTSEIIASDTIEDFSKQILDLRKASNEPEKVDVINLVQSSGKSLRERNYELVKHVINLVETSLSDDEIISRLENFKDLEHRQELIETKNGVHFISDVLSTAPLASLLAIDDLKLKYNNADIYILTGGIFRNVSLEELVIGINERIDFVHPITLSETGHMIEDKLEKYIHAEDLQQGVQIAFENAKAGDIILLAPGAPSFHKYKNYVELANHFKQIVNDL